MKLFYEDIREKKKAASGIHSRTGSRGYVGKMMMPVDFMTPKEKRAYQKNGKVRVYNMNNILLYQEFKELPAGEQKRLLEHWRVKYSNNLIFKNMGISRTQYYSLLKELSINTASGRGGGYPKYTYNQKEIETFKRDGIDYETFKTLEGAQRADVFDAHEQQFTVKELADFWGIKEHVIYNIKSRVKAWKEKNMEKKAEEIPEIQTETAQIATETPSQSVEVMKNEKSCVSHSEPISEYPKHNGFSTRLMGEFYAKEVAAKLRKLADFVESEEKKVRIELLLEE